MEKLVAIIVIFLGTICLIAGLGLLMAFPIKWCWNYAVVYVWHLPAITWGQAWCINFLAGCLIRSIHNSK